MGRVCRPPPQLRDYGQVFLLRHGPYYVVSDDAFDVFHVLNYMTDLHFLVYSKWTMRPEIRPGLLNVVKMRTGICDEAPPINRHTPIVVWNVRGVNRCCFPDRFRQMFDTHQFSLSLLRLDVSMTNSSLCIIGWGQTCAGSVSKVLGEVVDSYFIIMWDTSFLQVKCRQLPSNCTLLDCDAKYYRNLKFNS